MIEASRSGALSSARALAFIDLIKEIAIDANSQAPAEEVMQRALGAVGATTGAAIGHLYWRADPPPRLEPAPVWFPDPPGRFEAFREASQQSLFLPGECLPGRVLASAAPVSIAELASDERFTRRECAVEVGLQSGFAFPILIGPEVVAVFELYYDHPHEPDWMLLDIVAAVGTMLGRAIERHRARQRRESDEAERRRAELELRRREQQLSEAHRLARLGTWEWDIERDDIEWSDEMYRILGLEPAEVQPDYEYYTSIHHPDDRDRVMTTVREAIERRESYSVVHRIIRPDGAVRIIHGRGTVHLDERGEAVRLAGTAQDITDQIEAERHKLDLEREQERSRELLELAEALERSNQELDQFAYAVSHDLKAPLRGVKNLAAWLEEDLGQRLDDATREHLRLMSGRVDRMSAYIDGILEYSRAGRSGSEPEPVALSELLADVIDLLAPPPEAQVTVPDDLPTLHTERYPLQQVFQNLISNALKHGGPGVHVEIEWEAGSPDPVFCVCDNGPGIPADQRERIFEVFTTLQPRDQVEGAGIGLAVVKKIIERRGGRVWVDSDPGNGAVFSFTWPENRRERAHTIA